MKKRIARLLLAAVMLLTMTACGDTAETEETASSPVVETNLPEEVPATSGTEPFMPETILDESHWLEKCNENEAVTLQWNHFENYETVLHALGFLEFDADYDRLTNSAEEACRFYPRELTIAGNSFKLVFDYTLYDEGSRQFYEMKDYVLYGAKSDKADYLVRLPAENLVEEYVFDWNGDEVSQGDYFCHLIYYSASCNIDGAGWFTNTVRHYEDSHNLYNIVKLVPSQDPKKDGTPCILYEHKENFESQLEILGNQMETVETANGSVQVGEFTIEWNGMEETYQYRPGMTLEAWASSEWNTGSWAAGPDNCLYYENYVIRNADYDLRWLFTNKTTILAEQ